MKKTAALWLVFVLALSLWAPAALADGSDAVYYPYWRQDSVLDAYLPKTETVTNRAGESETFTFEYELRYNEGQRVESIIGRKYDAAGALREIRVYDGQGKPTRVTVYEDEQPVRVTEYDYAFDGLMFLRVCAMRELDVLTGETREVQYYLTGPGFPLPVEEGERPAFAFDEETRRIEDGYRWDNPVASARVETENGGRLFEGMRQEVSWPYSGSVCTAAEYACGADGEKGDLLRTRLENRSWFGGPYYVLEADYTGERVERSEDFYTYNSAVNCVDVWIHRDGAGETVHRYTFVYYDGYSGLEESQWPSSWARGQDPLP